MEDLQAQNELMSAQHKAEVEIIMSQHKDEVQAAQGSSQFFKFSSHQFVELI